MATSPPIDSASLMTRPRLKPITKKQDRSTKVNSVKKYTKRLEFSIFIACLALF